MKDGRRKADRENAGRKDLTPGCSDVRERIVEEKPMSEQDAGATYDLKTGHQLLRWNLSESNLYLTGGL